VLALARQDRNPLTELLRPSSAATSCEQRTQPDINWLDSRLGYFYHCHPSAARTATEHGHFHLFARAGNKSAASDYTHLIALAVDGVGAPLRAVTTNLWVTAGQWRSATHVLQRLHDFERLTTRRGSGPRRWLGWLLGLSRGEIRTALLARDARVRSWRLAGELASRFADRRIYVLSSTPLSLSSKVGS
jgi:hypothetical protein